MAVVRSAFNPKNQKTTNLKWQNNIPEASVTDRIIGRYTGEERGPLLIVIAGMHGNEPAGIEALESIFGLIHLEKELNAHFTFSGRIVGVRGNLQALLRGERYIERDFNRAWTPENIQRVLKARKDELQYEDRELRELLDLVQKEIEAYKPNWLVMLDLHTTAAQGGIFSIARDEDRSVHIAVELHAPVIIGMLKGLRGTTLHYFKEENLGVPTTAVAFEGGQHQDPVAVNRIIAAITNCLRTIGCVKAEDVENRHDVLLQEYSAGLPKVASLLYRHEISPEDKFRMLPGFENFQHVKKGQQLAQDRHGPIYAKYDALILMPLYQKQGDDGFFLIQPEGEGLFGKEG